MIYVINIRLDMYDDAGNMFYNFLVQADTRRMASKILGNYLGEINFPTDSIDKIYTELLKFDGSNVVEMKT